MKEIKIKPMSYCAFCLKIECNGMCWTYDANAFTYSNGQTTVTASQFNWQYQYLTQPIKVDNGQKKEINMKIGDRVRHKNSGRIGTITQQYDASMNAWTLQLDDGTVESFYAYSLELINDTKMEEIPKHLSVMERVTSSKEDKILIKAGYKANGEYTAKAKDLAIVLFLETQAEKLVTLAQEELDEAALLNK